MYLKKEIEESLTLKFAESVNLRKNRGEDILSLGLGEPDFETPKALKEGVIKALENSSSSRYSAALGLISLRKKIAEDVKVRSHIPCDMKNVIITPGTKQAVMLSLMALLEPEDEFGLDIMNDLDSNNVAVSVKQKLAMRAGETDKAVTRDLPEIYEIGKKIGTALMHVGNLDVDIMQRANGDYCVLELNPRFGGGFPFSYEAGVNLPKAIIEWVKGNKIDSSILHPKYGMMFSKNDYLMEITK